MMKQLKLIKLLEKVATSIDLIKKEIEFLVQSLFFKLTAMFLVIKN